MKNKSNKVIADQLMREAVGFPTPQQQAIDQAKADAQLWHKVDAHAREKAGEEYDFSSMGTPPPLPTTYEQLRAIVQEYASIGANAALTYVRKNQPKGAR